MPRNRYTIAQLATRASLVELEPVSSKALLARIAELEGAVRDHRERNGTMAADQILWAVIEEEDASV